MTIGVSKFDPTNPLTPDDFTTVPAAADNAVDLLSGALNANAHGNVGSTQVIALHSTSKFPTTGGFITIGQEQISYTGIVLNTLTGITRGANDTTIKAHGDRAAVVLNITAAMWNVLCQAVFNAQAAVTTGSPANEEFEIGTCDGTASIILTHTVVAGRQVKLFIGGVFYTETIDFTRLGTNITLITDPLPPGGTKFVAMYPA